MTSIYMFCTKGLTTYDKPVYDKFDLLFKDTTRQDIVFLGSSRTYYGVNSFLLEKLTHKKVINAGLEGAKIYEMELALKGYLFKHPQPDKLFLMLDPHSFTPNQSVYNKIYFSNYFENDSICHYFSNIIGYKAYLWKWLPYSLITEFDDYTRLKCLKGNFSKIKSDSNFNYKGFSLLKKKFTASSSDFDVSGVHIPEADNPLYNIIAICKSNNIQLHIIQGPYLKSYYEKNKINYFYNELKTRVYARSHEFKVQTNALNYDKTDYFKDETHLNDLGSTRFTLDLFTTFINDKK
ncbi:MAG: hypothetical protein V4677_03855 [Bacteroidota bacterium]